MQDYNIVGKTLAETARILGDKYSYRVVSRDGVAYAATCDYDPHRYNLTLVDGRVVSYTKG